MSLPSIPCQYQNHYRMPFEYLCLESQCLKNNKQLCCIYCCQQLHNSHLQKIQALKIVLSQFKKSLKPSQFDAGTILVNGIYKCKTEIQFHQNLKQLIAFCSGPQRFQKLVDRSSQIQKQQTKEFYQKRNQNKDSSITKTVKKGPQTSDTVFITPILTFSAEDATQQQYQLKSPFCVVNSAQKLVTAFAYPALNKFNESIQINIKIERITPFWLGIGISFGKKKYQQQSKDHILVTSNGWINVLGNLQLTNIKYCLKDTVRIKFDRRLQLLQFFANSHKHSVPIDIKWNQDIFLCCVLFYKDDSVRIID